MRKQTAVHLKAGVPVTRIGVMAAFGCNYQGDISPAQVVQTVADGLAVAAEAARHQEVSLADTMGWATPDPDRAGDGAVRSAGRNCGSPAPA